MAPETNYTDPVAPLLPVQTLGGPLGGGQLWANVLEGAAPPRKAVSLVGYARYMLPTPVRPYPLPGRYQVRFATFPPYYSSGQPQPIPQPVFMRVFPPVCRQQ